MHISYLLIYKAGYLYPSTNHTDERETQSWFSFSNNLYTSRWNEDESGRQKMIHGYYLVIKALIFLGKNNDSLAWNGLPEYRMI